MNYVFLFISLIFPFSAFADISTQTWGSGGSFSTSGTDVTFCSTAQYTYLRSDPNEINYEHATNVCTAQSLVGYEAKNFFYIVENGTGLESADFYWCTATDEEFTLNSDGTTGCTTSGGGGATTTFATSTDQTVMAMGIAWVLFFMSMIFTGFIWNKV